MKSPFYVPSHLRNQRSVRWWLRIGLVPLILVVVAGLHMFQWSMDQRSSWGAGCGFGMFATVDAHGSRFVRCQHWSDKEWQEFVPNGQLVPKLRLCRVHPIPSNLRSVAIESFKMGLVESSLIRVEVWGVTLSPDNGKLSSHLIRQVTVRHHSAEEPMNVAKR